METMVAPGLAIVSAMLWSRIMPPDSKTDTDLEQGAAEDAESAERPTNTTSLTRREMPATRLGVEIDVQDS